MKKRLLIRGMMLLWTISLVYSLASCNSLSQEAPTPSQEITGEILSTNTPTFTDLFTPTISRTPTRTPTPMPQWRNIGPFGVGTPLAIDPVHPSRLYASSGFGSLFRSDTGGTYWGQIYNDRRYSYDGNNGETPSNRFAIDPKNPKNIFLVTSSGLERSTNYGDSWQVVLDDEKVIVDCVFTSSASPSGVFIGYAERMEQDRTYWNVGVMSSNDNGNHWTVLNDSISKGYSSVNSILIDPLQASTIYIGTSGNGILKSTDGGKTWKAKNSGLPEGYFGRGNPKTRIIGELIIDPANPAMLFTINNGEEYQSSNGGDRWSAMEPFGTMVFDPSMPTTVYKTIHNSVKGLFKSTDGRKTWNSLPVEISDINKLLPGPAAYGLIIIGSPLGIFSSSNGGATWKPINKGFPPVPVTTVAILPNSPNTIFASTGSKILKSVDGGTSWNAVPDQPINARNITGLLVNPDSPETMYAFGDGLYKSENGGNAWTEIKIRQRCIGRDNILTIDPNKPSTLYWMSEIGFCISENEGRTWKETTANRKWAAPYAITIAPTVPTTIYALMGDGLYKSQDVGKNWVKTTGSKPLLPPFDWEDIRYLVYENSNPSIIYAATYSGLYRTIDEGGYWKPMSLPVKWDGLSELIIDPTTPSSLYASFNLKDEINLQSYGGIWRSKNSGKTWEEVTLEHSRPVTINQMVLEPGIPTNPMALYPGIPTSLYVATNKGVYILDQQP
jgi:photosystem II stability/assembly factor-like uncharacterized protein